MKGTMKAARFYKAGEPLKIEEVPIPQIGSNDVLLKVRANGICGSDIHILEGVTPTGSIPQILGHEFAGEIAEVGSEVKNWQIGDRVCVDSIVSCDSCYNCLRGRESICVTRKLLGIHLDGGMAEYARVPARNLIRLPENVPFDQGAIVTDAVATPFHALFKRGHLQLGDTVAVFGIGGLGIHAVQLAKIGGAAQLIAVDVFEENLERAVKVGADYVVKADEADPVKAIKDLTGGRGVDIALECIGKKSTIEQSLRSICVGGKAVIVGLGPDAIETQPPTVYVRNEYELIGSYSFERGEINKLVNMIASGRLDLSLSITERLPLEETNTALEHLQNKIGNPIRIVIVQD